MIADMGVCTVPCLHHGPWPHGLEGLRRLVAGARSAFCASGDVPVEGVYVRVDRQEGAMRAPRWLAARAKLVRPDFIQVRGTPVDPWCVCTLGCGAPWRRDRRPGWRAQACALSGVGLQPRRGVKTCVRPAHAAHAQAIEEGGDHWSKRALVHNIVRADLWSQDEDADAPLADLPPSPPTDAQPQHAQHAQREESAAPAPSSDGEEGEGPAPLLVSLVKRMARQTPGTPEGGEAGEERAAEGQGCWLAVSQGVLCLEGPAVDAAARHWLPHVPAAAAERR